MADIVSEFIRLRGLIEGSLKNGKKEVLSELDSFFENLFLQLRSRPTFREMVSDPRVAEPIVEALEKAGPKIAGLMVEVAFEAQKVRLVEVEQKAQELRFDKLTSLPKAEIFEEDVINFLAKDRREQMYIFGLVDLADFKKVNDAYGHPVGDDVIVAFAQGVLKKELRNRDVGRKGGDEFFFFVPTNDCMSAHSIAERIIFATKVFDWRGVNGNIDFPIMADIGTLCISKNVVDSYRSLKKLFSDSYRVVDKAMYSAKKRRQESSEDEAEHVSMHTPGVVELSDGTAVPIDLYAPPSISKKTSQ